MSIVHCPHILVLIVIRIISMDRPHKMPIFFLQTEFGVRHSEDWRVWISNDTRILTGTVKLDRRQREFLSDVLILDRACLVNLKRDRYRV